MVGYRSRRPPPPLAPPLALPSAAMAAAALLPAAAGPGVAGTSAAAGAGGVMLLLLLLLLMQGPELAAGVGRLGVETGGDLLVRLEYRLGLLGLVQAALEQAAHSESSGEWEAHLCWGGLAVGHQAEGAMGVCLCRDRRTLSPFLATVQCTANWTVPSCVHVGSCST